MVISISRQMAETTLNITSNRLSLRQNLSDSIRPVFPEQCIDNESRNSKSSLDDTSSSHHVLDGVEASYSPIHQDLNEFRRRHKNWGPLPDLRFEQSYLNSIAGAKTAWGVAIITFRDQVILPLLQGTLWALILQGWGYWNYTARTSGSSMGTRLRRWWYKTKNSWLPEKIINFGPNTVFAARVGDVSARWNGAEHWNFTD